MSLLRNAMLGLAGVSLGLIANYGIDNALEERFVHDVETYGMRTTVWDEQTPVTITIGESGPLEHVIGITADAPSKVHDLVDTLGSELASSPGFYTDECSLTNVRIVENLRLEGTKRDGAYALGTVYLDANSWNPRSVVVHELNHLCIDKNLHPFALLWNATFNPRTGTRYVGDDWKESSSNGFSRSYGSKNWFEDVATIAEDLLLREDRVLERSARDATYARKARIVSSFYRELGHPAFELPTSGGR